MSTPSTRNTRDTLETYIDNNDTENISKMLNNDQYISYMALCHSAYRNNKNIFMHIINNHTDEREEDINYALIQCCYNNKFGMIKYILNKYIKYIEYQSIKMGIHYAINFGRTDIANCFEFYRSLKQGHLSLTKTFKNTIFLG